MDDISRDPQPDTTTRSPGETPFAAEGGLRAKGPGKGPEEFLLAERNELREDLVVGRERAVTRREPADEPPPQWVLENRLSRQRLPDDEVAPADVAAPAVDAEAGSGEQAVVGAAVAPEAVDPEAVDPEAVLAAQVAELATVDPSPVELPELTAAVPESVPALDDEAATAAATGLVEPELQEDSNLIDASEAAAAVAEEAEVAEIEEELAHDEELPPVPELRDVPAIARTVFVLMLTSREGLTMFRLAQACNTTQKLVEQALAHLHEQLQAMGLPIELARNGDTVKWMSSAEMFPYLQRLRGVKKLEKLSPAALETLAVIAYRQPVMRSEIEAIRGVKAGPMLRTLLQHKLVQTKGRAEVPGRPLQYGTTPQFLERFGLASLAELPSIKEWKNLG